MASDADAKRVFLRLLEEDEEFRYAVAAKIGLLEILQKLEEHDRKFNEILAELREHRKKLEEHDRKFNEILKRLDRHEEENKKIWEEIHKIWKKLEEHDRKFNEILAELREHRKKLEEHDRKFIEILERLDRHEEILLRHEEILLNHGRRLDRIEMELGALSESFYCRAVWEDLSAEIAGRGEKVVFRRRNLKIDDKDIDLFIETDKAIYVVEVKIKPKHKHVDELLSKAKLMEKRYPGKKVVPVLAGALIGSEIESYARSNNVLVYVY